MVAIATPSELASSLQVPSVDTASAELYLELAQGLITTKIGERDPWPVEAKGVALASAGRAYDNPTGAKRRAAGPFTAEHDPAAAGVYLTQAEIDRLLDWLNGPGGGKAGRPQGSFPPARGWPDPVEVDGI